MPAKTGDYAYRPILALPYWSIIGPFVDEAVAEAADRLDRKRSSLYPATTAFVLWCWQTRGTELNRSGLFRWPVIDEFIHLAMPTYLRGSRATHRSTLRAIASVLTPATHQNHHTYPVSRSAPTIPYGPPEISALYSWAMTQTTPQRQRDALLLLVLGLGAGLATRELLAITPRDVDVATMHITVRTGRIRTVPIHPTWQNPLRRIVPALDPEATWMFRPGRASAQTGQVTDFVLKSRTQLDIRPVRMRTTWLVDHLNTGTPPHRLLAISGLSCLAALDRLTPYFATV